MFVYFMIKLLCWTFGGSRLLLPWTNNIVALYLLVIVFVYVKLLQFLWLLCYIYCVNKMLKLDPPLSLPVWTLQLF